MFLPHLPGFWVIQSCQDVWNLRLCCQEQCAKLCLRASLTSRSLLLSATMHSAYSLYPGWSSDENWVLVLLWLSGLVREMESAPSDLGILLQLLSPSVLLWVYLIGGAQFMILPGWKGDWEGEYLAFTLILMEGSLCSPSRRFSQSSRVIFIS